MTLVAFTLSMPGRSSWDGRWSGEGRLYVIVRRVKTVTNDLLGYHSYAWQDGWCASIEASIVDSKEAAKLRKRSAGFCGYDWMVDSLLMDGRILASHQREREAKP